MANKDNALRNYKLAVTNVFKSFYANLSAALEGAMESFAAKAFAAGLISSPVMKNKTFSSIYQEFIVGIDLCRNILEIQKRWKNLIDILEDIGGPVRMAGMYLNEELTKLSDIGEMNEAIQYSREEDTDSSDIVRQSLPRGNVKSHEVTRVSANIISGQPLPRDMSESHEQLRVSTDGISGLSVQSLSSDEQISSRQVIGDTSSGVEMAISKYGELQPNEKKIVFDEKKNRIGIGSQGTVVYEGSFQSRPVAVKKVMSEHYDLVEREIKALQDADRHKNVVRYFYMEEYGGFHYIALELCKCTLFEYVDGTELQHVNSKEILFGAMSGVNHLHMLDIIHRDLKPQNILLKVTENEVIPVISDFGLCRKIPADQSYVSTKHGLAGTLGWTAPELSEDKSKVTPAIDIFAMGCIFYFVLSRGKHPFGLPIRRPANIEDGKFNLSDLEGEDKFTAEDLVMTMINKDYKMRPRSVEVLNHCLFWSKATKSDFFQKASDWIHESPLSTVKDDLEKGAGSVFINNWKENIDEELKQDLEKTGKYDGTLVRDLLRAIRNKIHHYHKLPETFKAKVHSPEGLVSYFTSQFPRLLIYTYNIMKTEPKFKEHYPDFFKT